MRIPAVIQRHLLQVIGPLIGAMLVVYFGYYALHGDRGLVALARVQTQIEDGSLTLDRLKGERAAIERRVKGLRPDSLDLDILDERARTLLNYAHPDDLVILHGPKTDGAPRQRESLAR